jgi:hypothetical protein
MTFPRSLALLSLAMALTPLLGCPRKRAEDAAGKAPSAATSRSAAFAGVRFGTYAVVDKQQGGMVAGTFSVPQDWSAVSAVKWDMTAGNSPAQLSARMSAPDGSSWVEYFPTEVFDWVQPEYQRTRPGTRNFGMIYYPHINVETAMRKFVIERYRGKAQDLQIVGFRSIPNLATALGKPPVKGDSLAARIRYTSAGHTIDEELFCILTADNPVASHSPVGTGYEHHRVLGYVHSMGAWDGKLDGLHPLLGFIAASFNPNPAWQATVAQVGQQIGDRFNRQLAKGYRQIAAAGARSRQISANNDAFLARMDAQRVASNQASEQRRQAANSAGSDSDKSNDGFDQYIRGTEKMADPYWGTSERSYNSQYHWTDGYGNYQDSNDATFDPNKHSNVNWQQMQPAK